MISQSLHDRRVSIRDREHQRSPAPCSRSLLIPLIFFSLRDRELEKILKMQAASLKRSFLKGAALLYLSDLCRI